jgi:LPXTG-motif cell wall-anchored protein
LVQYPPATDGCTPNPAIEVVKEVAPDPIVVGEATEVTWTVTVTNTGDSLLQKVELIDELIPGCNATIGNLDAGESVEQTCTATYTADTTAWTFENTAEAIGFGLWGTKVTDNDTATLTAIAPNSIGDTVWNDANANGVQDPGEKGIAGALVKLTLPDTTTTNTTTDADGKYLFSELGVGEYTVELVMSSIPAPAEGDLTLTTAGSYTILLAAGDVFLGADFGVVATLPKTGINTTGIAMVALVLLLVGAVAVLATTRRRKNDGDLKA